MFESFYQTERRSCYKFSHWRLFKMQFSVDYLSNQFIISFDQFNELKFDFKLLMKDEKLERNTERFTKQSYEFKEDSE